MFVTKRNIMQEVILRNARMVNRGAITEGDLWIREGRIHQIAPQISSPSFVEEIDLQGRLVIPGVIDDQVHFREPGMTHKAQIYTESRAAVAGGTTSFMEMPNTKPPALTRELLEQKYATASRDSLANYSFFMGTSNDNLDEVLRTDPANVCGIKIFMGSSTGNMLVDDRRTLDNLFSRSHMLIATHCEDEQSIKDQLAVHLARYGEDIPFAAHPVIRDELACYRSSSMAIELARQHNTRLHILHISTARELDLFDATKPLSEKRITSEVCVHHLHFSADDYPRLGSLIKCNPAIKYPSDRQALWDGLLADKLDIIATDHAPHTWEEKQQKYMQAPSGLPLVQHALVMMLQEVHKGRISLEKLVEKMCHAPAECFRIPDRGYLDEGAYADLVVVDPNTSWTISREELLYKCGWSPLEGEPVKGRIDQTYVNGQLVFDRGRIVSDKPGKRLVFTPLS